MILLQICNIISLFKPITSYGHPTSIVVPHILSHKERKSNSMIFIVKSIFKISFHTNFYKEIFHSNVKNKIKLNLSKINFYDSSSNLMKNCCKNDFYVIRNSKLWEEIICYNKTINKLRKNSVNFKNSAKKFSVEEIQSRLLKLQNEYKSFPLIETLIKMNSCQVNQILFKKINPYFPKIIKLSDKYKETFNNYIIVIPKPEKFQKFIKLSFKLNEL